MIITERFVFIHMHKTGGQTLNSVISRCMKDHRVVGYHYPRREIPAEASNLPVIGIVRNPWSWYVSWYSFNRQLKIQNPLFSIVSDGGREGFATTVRNLVNLGSGTDQSRRHRDSLTSILPDTLDSNRGVGLTRDDIEGFSDNNIGYYSWLFDRMVGINHDEHTLIGRFENLQEDFLKIAEHLGVAETGELAKALNQCERKNPSRHSHYSHYYDDELRQLIADKEYSLIQSFGYCFESIGPSEGHLKPESEPDADNYQGFRKLLGRADNFLLVNRDFDIRPLREKVLQITEDTWAESDRAELFEVHRHTQSIELVQFVQHLHDQPIEDPWCAEFEELLRPIVEHIARFYQDNGFVLRILFAKLRAGGNIGEHQDFGYSLVKIHRIHIPVITNEQVAFFVGGEAKQMRAGEFWEIDNSQKHAVENNSLEDRVHLIIDWMPNHSGLGKKEAISAVKLANSDTQVVASLDQVIAKSYEFQRTGDPYSAVCNNLMGMLYRQLHRYDDAIPHIKRALAADPNDAKTHSNLGQVFLMQGKFAESATSFENALSLNPGLESARIGLQRARLELIGSKQQNST
jgi:tetratricopeptide (TPR) repeat protein